MTRTNLLTLATQTSPTVNPGVDASGMTGDWRLVLEVQNLINQARFEFKDSLDNFSSDIRIIASVSVNGPTTKDATQRFTFLKRDMPFARFGQTSAKVRVELTDLTTGGPGTVTYQAWIESANS